MNTFGTNFRVSIFGESHGPMVGCTIDGILPGTVIDLDQLNREISRRKSGSTGTTQRKETDEPIIVSGIVNGNKASGAPMTILFLNGETQPKDYEQFNHIPRPGHADFPAFVKYHGFFDISGGGQFSGRLTLPIVAAGYVAKQVFDDLSINAELIEVGGVKPRIPAHAKNDPDVLAAIKKAASEGDSLGGIVECTIKGQGLDIGLGEPFWDSVESLISHAIFSIPGVRGIEFGDGFQASRMKGSEHNDPIGEGLRTTKNGAGGVNGGLTNGSPIVFRVAFKPTASIKKAQTTLDFDTHEMTTLKIAGRHDVCFALRTPVIVEAMAAIVMADLIQNSAAHFSFVDPNEDEDDDYGFDFDDDPIEDEELQ